MQRNAFLNIGFTAMLTDVYSGSCFLEEAMGGVTYYKPAMYLLSADSPLVRRITFGQMEDYLEEQGIDIVCEPNRKERNYKFLIFQTKDGETKFLKDLTIVHVDKGFGYEQCFKRCVELLKNKI